MTQMPLPSMAVPLIVAILSPGCSSDSTLDDGPSQLALDVARRSVDADAFRGGRLYDRFYRENSNSAFSPDDDATPGVADGSGGPNANGTLLDGEGNLVNNDLGHAFRLKNFFGWDLRGTAGVYGPAYQDKAYVLPFNLIDDPMDRTEVARLMVDGDVGAPAFGAVMPSRDLEDVVEFVMAVREHRLPRPSDIWDLEPSAPKGYVLRAGGDVAAGHSRIASDCAAGGCHGSDGTELLFDDGEYSMGTLARTSAYEVWFKLVAGNPGTDMAEQVPPGEPWQVQSQVVLDVLAALCDTDRYPAGAATEPDVSAGDPRCGTYLR